MNSKVLVIVALLFAGSVSAVVDSKANLFNFSSYLKKEVVKPTTFARFKEVVSNNPVKAGVAVVATVAVVSAVIAYAISKNEVVAEEVEENFFA